jgi:hypothetical protein
MRSSCPILRHPELNVDDFVSLVGAVPDALPSPRKSTRCRDTLLRLRRHHVAKIQLPVGSYDIRRQWLLLEIKTVQHIKRIRVSAG